VSVVVAVLGATGAGQAAMHAVIPSKNSVGTSQLKNNAVTGPKVKNGSLTPLDFKKGSLPAGPAGPSGPPGTAGPAGPAGPSDAFGVFRNAVSPPPLAAGATVTLATLTLQPGKYVAVAKVDFDDISGAPRTVTCRLSVSGTPADKALQTVNGIGGENCTVMAGVDIAAATAVTLEIVTPAGSQVRAGDAKVLAVKVASLANSSVTG
jgi:hypothetical protein